MYPRSIALIAVLWFASSTLAQTPGGSLAVDFDPHANYTFSGVVGERLAANKTGWLLARRKPIPVCWQCFACAIANPHRNSSPGQASLWEST